MVQFSEGKVDTLELDNEVKEVDVLPLLLVLRKYFVNAYNLFHDRRVTNWSPNYTIYEFTIDLTIIINTHNNNSHDSNLSNLV